jgi:hypothetical protein
LKRIGVFFGTTEYENARQACWIDQVFLFFICAQHNT